MGNDGELHMIAGSGKDSYIVYADTEITPSALMEITTLSRAGRIILSTTVLGQRRTWTEIYA